MNRDHSVKDFTDIVDALRREIPDAVIATDIIVGYPTEREEDFKQSIELLRKTKPEIVNLSKFSARPFTKAKEMAQLGNSQIKRRSEVLAPVIKDIAFEARRRYIGKTPETLILEKGKDFKGRAHNYNQVVDQKIPGKAGRCRGCTHLRCEPRLAFRRACLMTIFKEWRSMA